MVRRVRNALLLLVSTILGGTVGYMLVAGLGWLDALYQTVVTITTVGYTDLVPTKSVKPFTIVVALFGAVNMAYIISVVTGSLVEVQILGAFGRHKMEKQAKGMQGHAVICGYGRFGRTIAEELRRRRWPLVILERDPGRVTEGRDAGHIVLEHDATEEKSLTLAGIESARGLLTTLASDADNVYVTLTARQMNRGLTIIALAREERAESKLRAAGADRVISPYLLGGMRMAQVISSPTVADFVEIATGANPIDFYMEQIRLPASSPYAGHALRETPIRREFGAIVVAVKRSDGTMLINPSPDVQLATGDELVALGTRENLARLETAAAG